MSSTVVVTEQKSHRNWLRFSLRTGLIAIAVLSAAGAYVAHEWRIVRERKAAIEAVQKNHADKVDDVIRFGNRPLVELNWLRRMMGDFPRRQVVFPYHVTDAEMARLKAAYPEAEVSVMVYGETPERNWKRLISGQEEVIQREPENAFAHHILARCFVNIPEFRNVERAIELATKACELTEWKKGLYLETLALAHGETGDFSTAIKRMEEAVALEPENEVYKARLEGFKAGKPFREHSAVRPPEESEAADAE